MKKNKNFIYSIILLLIIGCSSNNENDCVKTIIIQNEFNFQSQYGSIFYPEVTQEVPCDFPEPEIPNTITELPRLDEFNYEILEFSFTENTGNNTSRLQYKIKLNNLSSKNVKGVPYITSDIDGLISSSPFTESCSEINANSSCIITRDIEESLNVVQIKNIKIINIEFLVIN